MIHDIRCDRLYTCIGVVYKVALLYIDMMPQIGCDTIVSRRVRYSICDPRVHLRLCCYL